MAKLKFSAASIFSRCLTGETVDGFAAAAAFSGELPRRLSQTHQAGPGHFPDNCLSPLGM
jgi:hypothetical protein